MPNFPVDVNSWGKSACYPRRTFYPLSDGPSTQNHRITKPCFRTCSTCLSCSQAPLCLYTRRLVSIQPEGTFGRLRYILGGDRPSQTTRLAMSPSRIHGSGLEPQNHKGGISLVAPRRLTPTYRRLPPMLHMRHRSPLPGCSKGARGLSV